MGQLLPPVALLLLVSASSRAADVPKAVVILDPPWASVLKDDHVTLKCQGPHPAGDNTTQWLHNGSLLSSQAPAYTITAARAEDGGEYRCQTGLSSLSDPVQLRVHLGLGALAERARTSRGASLRVRSVAWPDPWCTRAWTSQLRADADTDARAAGATLDPEAGARE
ncbi:low affinity immunoglobulin gamma Fc region receptor III-B-like [Lepus europaeus]|uniref:low affinity immunoglobulin gamma Fc region receptor III-B-like n=1 Tax=Lepus europaeus TaxID=9983 RepID=UPI002B47B4AF|nr:low affinity immunoglobulin gamma Fc region receptor III-B-like [Lepus europaeus]